MQENKMGCRMHEQGNPLFLSMDRVTSKVFLILQRQYFPIRYLALGLILASRKYEKIVYVV
jgi:hypothetical protein